ncbi:MAG: sialate O-acetylesterase [Alphaproteobacteria bacterium]|nr:sialate O-acetylesterase [Alphaproteobacteria bacterium]
MGKPCWMAAVGLLVFGLCGCASRPELSPLKPVVMAPKPGLLSLTFQDHAVLQRDKPIHVWGTTKPGATVTVAFAGEQKTATADATGGWQTILHAMPAGGPYVLSAKSTSGEKATRSDILVGDVYLCSGQSNMEYPLRLASDYDADLKGATNPNIRLFHVERFASALPKTHFGASATWSITTPETAKEFSAACYFFGRDLQPAVNVPIGLIEDSWGGSVILTWLASDKIRAIGGYEHELAVMDQYVRDPAGSKKEWMDYTNTWWKAHDPGTIANPAWSDPAYDDSAWAQHIAAGDWEGWGVPALSAFDGIVWMRKTVTLTTAQAKGAAVLSIGPADDIDTTWVNGVQVGGEEGWDRPRVYTVPAGVLHEGVNTIAVGVLDTGAGGGIWGPAEAKTITCADGSIVKLDTPWRYKISAPLTQTGTMQHAPWLNESGLSMLYNGMLLPLGPTALRGIIWYQGESDAAKPKEYARLLPALIADWRQQFGADVPFFVVQLPGYGIPTTTIKHSDWAELREAQRNVVDSTPNTALAVTIDVGARNTIHPTDKQDIGLRLALLARKLVYGQDIVATGPTPIDAVRNGKTITVHYANRGQGLVVYESNRPMGFQLCAMADHCQYADARQNGDSIEIDASSAVDATLVRYCWSDSPICNVYNTADLPAVPFELPITQGQPTEGKHTRKPRHRGLRRRG